MPNMVQTMFIASASSIQSSDTYMTIETPMFSSPTANLNGVRVTEAFIDDIVSNQDKYIGLPLVADVANLEARKFDRLGHRYDRRKDTYGTQIIGAFYSFKKEERPDGEKVLVGYARVMKRNKEVCAAIDELFAQGGLKFSFEISCGTYTKLQDGTIEIDADDHNCWESMCIVSSPAYPDAIAYQLVAETDAVGKEEAEHMNENKEENIVAEDISEAEVETSEVHVTQIHKEMDEEHTFDTETGVETHTTVVVEECVCAPEAVVAEGDSTPAEETPAETVDEDSDAGEAGVAVTTDDESTQRNAAYEAFVAEMDSVIEAMKAETEALKQEIAELKESMAAKVVAETESAVNPFMADMSIEQGNHHRKIKVWR